MGQAEPGLTARPLPLAGVRILSAEQYGAAPYGTMLLAQLGADVIKIEPPQGGDTARSVGPHFLSEGESLFFQAFNLNKRSMTLDLARREGFEVFRRLVATSDAVAGNLRGDLPAKLGLTYAGLSDVNPAIVCAHISAYGRDNSRAAWPGYDYLAQAEAGFCLLTGEPGAPPARFGLSVIDFMTGTMMATGLLAALLEARRTGVGRDVDVDLMSTAVHQTSYPALWYMNEGDEIGRAPHSAHPSVAPSQCFPTADGHIFVMAQLPKFWRLLVERIGRPELANDPRFADEPARLEHRDALTEILDAAFAARTTAYWLERLQGQVPVAPVKSLGAALDNPYLAETRMRQSVSHPDRPELHVLANPIKVDGQRLPARAAPKLGADSVEILHEIGLSRAEVAELRDARLI